MAGALGGAVLAAVVGAVRWLEPRFVYQPAGAGSFGTRRAYADVAEGRTKSTVEDVWLTTGDGVRIHAWWLSPKGDTRGGALDDLPVFLWFHGNAGNVGTWLSRYESMVELPAHVLAVDFRGFGRSEGTPGEEGLYRDADAAWDYLTRELRIPAERILVYGFSLGGAVAVDLASRVQAGGLVIEASFTSLPEVASTHYRILPQTVLRTKMDSLSKIGGVNCPKLFFHSPKDRVVPFELGRKLFDAAPGPKEFLQVDGVGHNETFEAAGNRLFDALRQLVKSGRH
jgi:pimeloyl-ACP methyl ester carboxylesterase